MKKLITEEDILRLSREGKREVSKDARTIFTPSAIDRIRALNMKIVENNTPSFEKEKSESSSVNSIAVGSDHTGFSLKKIVIDYLSAKGYNVTDVGTDSNQSCDYPDYAMAVAKKRVSGECDRGIMIDATGIPSAITINKLPGIRAATCYNEFSARSAREHNNVCVLCVGAKTLGEETVKSILDVFLSTQFLGGRHQRRLDKIAALEQKLLIKNDG